MKNVISNRIADVDIYNNKCHYDEPKEYFSVVLDRILLTFHNPLSLLDIGCANGSFLHHAKTALVGTELSGAEPVANLADVARKSTSIKIIELGLFDLPEDCQYEVITMLGVLGIFSDLENVLTKLKSLMRPGGGVFVFSPFNEEDVDVILSYRRAPAGPWESGHNLFSMKTVESVSENLGLKCNWVDFSMSKPISKSDDPMRSWTEPFRGNNNHLIYGTNMFSTMKLLILR